ncbi:restriction endonuclease [Desulforegula conservatrix]|uniref:restriction endonuclease n=1 Tax=Desulforegula conservatrix TaxID=153026 RepID=UPI00041F6AD9|nr:restriction endonuclease [Desulforegula conservatrix]
MSKKAKSEFTRFLIPVIEVIRNLSGSGAAGEVTDLVIEKLNISDSELSETLKNGASKIRNQVAWARMYLVNSGFLDSSIRGVWSLTEKGLNADLSLIDLNEIIKAARTKSESNATSKDDASKPGIIDESVDIQPHQTELLALLKSMPPSGFERLCQRLLREAGFKQVVVTGKSNDGGIDGQGVLEVNPFVSFNVIFQCKRYKDAVSAPQIRDLRGAMQGRAEKGIFLTTGRFTLEAKKEARRDGVPPIELVDGQSLIEMFERLELDLNPVKSFTVNHDFFDEYMQSAKSF